MKKLVKPSKSIEDYSNQIVEALCDYDGCGGNCREDGGVFCAYCKSVNSDENEDDILF